jgi:hypothetical protein
MAVLAALLRRLLQAIGNCKGRGMNTDRRSWRLKVERADRHLEEVKSAMADYASRQPFRAVRASQPKNQRHIWLYRLEMTEEPDPMILVIIGECLYDLRSALDHLAVAMAPKIGGPAPPSRSSGPIPGRRTRPAPSFTTMHGAGASLPR